MKWLKEHIGGLVGCLIELAVGILLLVSPTAFIAAILTGCGALLLLLGAFCVGRYFFTPAEEASLGQWLFKGLLGVAAGLFLVLRADMIVAAQALLTVVYGVVLFGVGLYKVQWTVDAIRLKKTKWLFSALAAVVMLGCAATVVFYPFESTVVMWTASAVVLLVQAVLDLLALVLGKTSAEGEEEASAEPKEEEQE